MTFATTTTTTATTTATTVTATTTLLFTALHYKYNLQLHTTTAVDLSYTLAILETSATALCDIISEYL